MESNRFDDRQFQNEVASGKFPPAQFNHRAHLRLAYLLLNEAPFLEACVAMRDTLKTFAVRAGKPGLYHETVTVAFMSIVAERIAAGNNSGFDEFLDANPDLLDRGLLHLYYPPEVLASQRARDQFVIYSRT